MRRVVIAFAAAVLLAPLGAAQAPVPTAVSAWVAAPAAGATWAAAYVEVSNPTMYEIYVTGATADAAPTVELRAAASGDAEPPVVPEFPVPAYGSTSAAKGAPHLRLVGLTRPLKAGDTVALTLTTDGGLTLKVAAAVK
jgi:copper(I)-binding protein